MRSIVLKPGAEHPVTLPFNELILKTNLCRKNLHALAIASLQGTSIKNSSFQWK